MLTMWGESLKDVNCKSALINYEDFVLLMKGQKRERSSSISLMTSLQGLAVVPEIIVEDEEDSHTSNESFFEVVGTRPSLSKRESPIDLLAGSASQFDDDNSFARKNSSSLPSTPIRAGKSLCDIVPQIDGDDSGRVIFNDKSTVFTIPDLNFTPPQTPVRGPADYVTPTVARGTINPQLLSLVSPPIIPLLSSTRGRSVSMDENETSLTRGRAVSLDEDVMSMESTLHYSLMLNLKRDSRRAMAIPEHTHNISDIDRVIEDKTKTPLVVNRKLYRAHREFRHAVTEACRRFEDEQMRRAEVTLKAQESACAKHKAGLVMRHGQALSEQSIKSFLKKTLDEQQIQVDQANRRGGRGRGSRKKTISDMSGMLGGAVLQESAMKAEVPFHEALAPVNEDEEDDNLLRHPTKPGEFRKTSYNPFQIKQMLPHGNNTMHSWTNARSVSLNEILRES